MALQAIGSQYWQGDGVVNAVPVKLAPYKNYMSASVLYVSLIPVLPIPRRLQKRLIRWAWWGVVHLVPERLYLFVRLVMLLWGPDWARARAAVRQTATTPGLADRKAWGEIGRRAADHPGVGENVFRHLRAIDAYGTTPYRHASTRNLRLELAWLALKERHR